MNRDTHLKHYTLHSWIGILTGLVLYVLLISGSIAVFRHELELWQTPVSRQAQIATDASSGIDALLRESIASAKGIVKEIDVGLPTAHHSEMEVTLHVLDPRTNVESHQHKHFALVRGVWEARDEPQPGVAGMLFDLHSRLHLPAMISHAVLGLAGMMMLVLLISGVVIHRKLLSNMFTWRTDRSARVNWLDFHNIIGVWALPFHFIIAITAIPFALHTGPWLMLMTVGATGGKMDADNVNLLLEKKLPPVAGAAASANLDAVLEDARRREPGFQPVYVKIGNWGDATARISIMGYDNERASLGPGRVYDGVQGEFLGQVPDPMGEGSATGSRLFMLLLSLHAGSFAGYWSRTLWFLLGIGSALLVVSGQLLWLERKRAAASNDADSIVINRMAALTIGVCAGLPAAISVALAAWPFMQSAGWSNEGYGWSGVVFAAAWIAAVVLPFTVSHATANRVLLAAAGLFFVAAMLVRTGLHQDHLLSAWQSGRFGAAVIDGGLIVIGLSLLFISWRVMKNADEEKQISTLVPPVASDVKKGEPVLAEGIKN